MHLAGSRFVPLLLGADLFLVACGSTQVPAISHTESPATYLARVDALVCPRPRGGPFQRKGGLSGLSPETGPQRSQQLRNFEVAFDAIPVPAVWQGTGAYASRELSAWVQSEESLSRLWRSGRGSWGTLERNQERAALRWLAALRTLDVCGLARLKLGQGAGFR